MGFGLSPRKSELSSSGGTSCFCRCRCRLPFLSLMTATVITATTMTPPTTPPRMAPVRPPDAGGRRWGGVIQGRIQDFSQGRALSDELVLESY